MSSALLLHYLWIVAVVIGLAGSATAIGAWTLDRLALPGISRAERQVIGAGLGLGLGSAATLALGLLSLLSIWTVRATLTFLLVLGAAAYLHQRISRIQNRIPEIQNALTSPRWVRALLCIGTLLLLCAAFSCLSPMVDYDGLSYHIAAPKRWLELGGMRHLPTHLHTEWPMGFEMLFLLLLPTSGPEGGKMLVAVIAAFTVAAVYLLGKRIASAPVGAAAAALTLVGIGPDKINTTSIEVPLAFFVTLSALALAAWQVSTNEARMPWLLLAGVCVGLANSTKLNGLLATAILTLVVFTVAGNRPRPWQSRSADALLFGFTAVLMASPWYLRAWHDTGNPIFPFGWPQLGGRHWPAEASHTLTIYFRLFNLPGDTISARQSVLIRHLVRYIVVGVAVVALPAPSRLRAMAAYTALFAVLQTLSSDQPRFFVPALPFAAILAAWWIMWLHDRWSGCAWLFVVGLALYSLPEAVRAAWNDAPVILGARARAAYVSHYVNVARACQWANGALPMDARVLFGLDTRTFFLERDAYWSNSILQHHIEFGTMEQTMAGLREAHIGYLIYNRSLLHVESVQFEMRNLGRDREVAALEALAKRSILLWQEDEVSVYRLPAPVQTERARSGAHWQQRLTAPRAVL